jgi:hypothetical protein
LKQAVKMVIARERRRNSGAVLSLILLFLEFWHLGFVVVERKITLSGLATWAKTTMLSE